jgi:hypothetical protein
MGKFSEVVVIDGKVPCRFHRCISLGLAIKLGNLRPAIIGLFMVAALLRFTVRAASRTFISWCRRAQMGVQALTSNVNLL